MQCSKELGGVRDDPPLLLPVTNRQFQRNKFYLQYHRIAQNFDFVACYVYSKDTVT